MRCLLIQVSNLPGKDRVSTDTSPVLPNKFIFFGILLLMDKTFCYFNLKILALWTRGIVRGEIAFLLYHVFLGRVEYSSLLIFHSDYMLLEESFK